ncbi:hypothetical protein MF672_018220 [Actinomadura sp. ATCC 31491]|uniref:DUF2231 domain-containing protein n=1 Tax=Actinomadura luzonensis TaxID=2805427 RepID=A0ABT0FTP8_9ACTN|nr:hypothetical protein [Actinomadura luzonensis]MCK2215712.1 hypothetical protein [Actinomadura luzonensis]
MPVHVIAAHLVVITAPLTALLALGYAWRPGIRRALRLPLVAAGVLNVALAVWAEEAGSTLYEALRASAARAGKDLPATVLAHAHQGDALTAVSFALAVTVLAVVWWVLAPGRARGAGAVAASCLLTAAVAAVWWYTGTTLVAGLESVWAQHVMWPS